MSDEYCVEQAMKVVLRFSSVVQPEGSYSDYRALWFFQCDLLW